MKAYKLLRKLSDGNLYPLFIHKTYSTPIGEWMKVYGETIYGTRGGDVTPRDWGVTTRKGDKLYVHILNLPDTGLFLPLTTAKVKSAVTFKDKTPVKFKQDKSGVLLELAGAPEEVDYAVELTVK